MAKREPSKRARRDSGGPRQPNILVIWGDDIRLWNVGAYSHETDLMAARRDAA